MVFTSRQFPVPGQVAEDLAHARIRIGERPVIGLRAHNGQLAAVALADGAEIAREVLFVRPPQRQTPLVASLGLALDARRHRPRASARGTGSPGTPAAPLESLTGPAQPWHPRLACACPGS